MFVVILLRDLVYDFGVEFERLRHREILEISARANKNTIGSHLNREVDYVIFSLSARLAKSRPDEFQDRIAKPGVKFQAAKQASERKRVTRAGRVMNKQEEALF